METSWGVIIPSFMAITQVISGKVEEMKTHYSVYACLGICPGGYSSHSSQVFCLSFS